MSASPQRTRKKSRILSTIIFCLLLVIATIFILAYRQRIVDQITVWGYKATPQTTSLVKRAGMNDNGIFYYYASQPSLYDTSSATSFNKVCNSTKEKTAILGCYSGNKIYIYSDAGHVSDEANLLTFTAHENVWRAKYQKPD